LGRELDQLGSSERSDDDDDEQLEPLRHEDDQDDEDDQDESARGETQAQQKQRKPRKPRQPDVSREDRASRSKARKGQAKSAKSAQTESAQPAQTVPDPKTYAEAMAGPDAPLWKAAVSEQLQGHRDLRSYEEVIVPLSRRVISGKWVFVSKLGPNGKVLRRRARFVVRGFLQQRGVDYKEVFSPTIRKEQVRLMIAVAAKQTGLKISEGCTVRVLSKGDVTDAYLNAPMPEGEEVLFELPQGYEPTLVAPPGMKVVARSLTAIPGMRQAGRVWNGHLHQTLLERGSSSVRWHRVSTSRRWTRATS
jgi:hypothetical protein